MVPVAVLISLIIYVKLSLGDPREHFLQVSVKQDIKDPKSEYLLLNDSATFASKVNKVSLMCTRPKGNYGILYWKDNHICHVGSIHGDTIYLDIYLDMDEGNVSISCVTTQLPENKTIHLTLETAAAAGIGASTQENIKLYPKGYIIKSEHNGVVRYPNESIVPVKINDIITGYFTETENGTLFICASYKLQSNNLWTRKIDFKQRYFITNNQTTEVRHHEDGYYDPTAVTVTIVIVVILIFIILLIFFRYKKKQRSRSAPRVVYCDLAIPEGRNPPPHVEDTLYAEIIGVMEPKTTRTR